MMPQKISQGGGKLTLNCHIPPTHFTLSFSTSKLWLCLLSETGISDWGYLGLEPNRVSVTSVGLIWNGESVFVF